MADRITVFADFTCPFCYLTEAALRPLAAAAAIPIRYRAFQLFPHPSPLPEDSLSEQLRWAAPLAEALGLDLRDPGFRPRTGKAHEAAAFAAARGCEEALRDAIYSAYWLEGSDVGRIDVLCALAAPLGIDPVELKIALDVDAHSDRVRTDQELADNLRILAVPVVYIGSGPHARVLLGGQRTEDLDAALAAR